MARYSLYVLKVPLNTKQASKQTNLPASGNKFYRFHVGLFILNLQCWACRRCVDHPVDSNSMSSPKKTSYGTLRSVVDQLKDF